MTFAVRNQALASSFSTCSPTSVAPRPPKLRLEAPLESNTTGQALGRTHPLAAASGSAGHQVTVDLETHTTTTAM